ncbi:MAG: DUF1775 domain-containing protein [Acidobacteria bacterium]|nr:DUF1775 domain-containing protein [Acidobacteriota bacterium]
MRISLSNSSRCLRHGLVPLRMAVLAGMLSPLHAPLRAHVTLRPAQPLVPGGYATVNLNVPSERHVGTVSVTLEVPDAFLNAGGRLSRVEFPAGWEVKFEKQNKPGEVYEQEMNERSEREPSQPQPGAGGPSDQAQTPEQMQEAQVMDEARKQWIKRVTFSGGSIPPDGFKNFLLSFQMPKQLGTFRFPATQVYEDGKEVAWTELVEGAERPAPALSLTAPATRSMLEGQWPLVAGGFLLLAIGWMMGRGRAKHA